MIKIYRKTGIIKAEQFDGSNEMVNKYHTRLEGWENINVGYWIETGANGDYWAITDDVFKNKYVELPVIPKNVACLIKQDKERNYNLAMTFNDAYSRHIWKDGIGEWTIEHSDMFARAWLDGYQVEAQHDTRTD